MKSQSTTNPSVFHNIGNGKTHYNHNIVAKQENETLLFEYDQVTIIGEVNRDNVINALIRDRYSINEELAIQRQRESKPDEFESYNDFCEGVKKQVKKDIDGFAG